MEIKADKRIELMAVIQTMNNYWDNLSLMFSNKKLFQCKYKENIDNYFCKYKDHETLKLIGELCNNIQEISTLINFSLCYSEPPNLYNIANIDKNIKCLSKQDIQHEILVTGIKRFYDDTNFEYFFENNQNEYEKLLNDYINKNDLKEYLNKIDIYLGNNTENYTIAVSALLMGNFGIKIITDENVTYNYSIISPYDYKENKYIFGSKLSILDTFWHEISHLTINELTKNHINQINSNDKTVHNDFRKIFYTDTETIINEYIVRAITIRLLEINYGEEIVKNLIQDNFQKGFTEIESIKNYISKNCEKDNKFTREGYKELLDYVLNKI